MTGELPSDPYCHRKLREEQARADEEAFFEVWFQLHRKKTFERTARPGDRIEDHPHWSMGLRDAYLEGWMARASLHVTQAKPGDTS
jgi:hypothetical protein